MPDRFALEAFLSAGEAITIGEWCRRTGIDRAVWPEQRALASYIDLAVARYIERWPGRRALDHAAKHFGIDSETIRKRLYRRRKRAA